MLLAEDFVFLHHAKTGGSFVTNALTEIYAAQCGNMLIDIDKHGRVEDIPEEYRKKSIVTIVRNPFDYYVSNYVFGYWIERDSEYGVHWNATRMRAHFPGYPYLTFREFIKGALELGGGLPERDWEFQKSLGLGALSIKMLAYSVRDYRSLLEPLGTRRDLDRLKQEIQRTRFLHTERLNQETRQWLTDLGIPQQFTRPIEDAPKIQPLNTPGGTALRGGHGQPRTLDWQALFDDDTIQLVLERDWLFFELFPEYSHDGSLAPRVYSAGVR